MIGLKFTTEALIRAKDGKLTFIGMPTDPRKCAVERCNAGQCGQAEIDALEGLPVFDEDALDPNGENALFLVEQIGRMV